MSCFALRMFLLSFLALSLSAGMVTAESHFPWFVQSEGGLRLRSSPDLKATILFVIPDGTEVEFLEEKPQVLTISGVTGKWTKVSAPDQGEGWVFGGFLFDSRSYLEKLAGSYDSTMPTEPGDAPRWLRITESVIYSGYGGDMQANWYCMVAKVQRKDNIYIIDGKPGTEPKADEIQWLAADAESKSDLIIFQAGQNTVTIDDETFKRRR